MTRGAALLSACLVSASLAQAGPRAVEQGPARSPVTEVPSLAPAAANGDGFSLTTGPNALIGAPPLAIVAPTPSALSIERAAAATPLVEPPPGAVPAPPAAPIPTWTPAPTQAPPKPSPTVASEEAPKIGGEPLQAELGAFQHAAAQGGAKVGARFDGSESVSASAELELSRLAGDMNGRGFGSVSAAHFAPPSLARAVAELYGSWAAKSEGTSASRAIEFYDANRHVEWGSPDAPAALTADVRRLMEGLLAALQARFDKEGLYLGQVELRFVRNDLPMVGGFPHTDDGDYFTMTLELLPDGIGTTLYDTRNGRVETVETPSGRIALLNGGMRESYLGFPAPAHAGPQHPVPRRATLVAHIASRTGRFVRDMGEVLDAGQARVDAVTAHQARVRN